MPVKPFQRCTTSVEAGAHSQDECDDVRIPGYRAKGAGAACLAFEQAQAQRAGILVSKSQVPQNDWVERRRIRRGPRRVSHDGVHWVDCEAVGAGKVWVPTRRDSSP